MGFLLQRVGDAVLSDKQQKASVHTLPSSASVSSAPSSASDAGKVSSGTVVGDPIADPNRWIKDLVKGFESAFSSSARSALELQKKYTDEANALTEKWNKKAMDFESHQAELNRIFQSNSARDAMKFSADEAQKNREWQEQMSNTAFQRAMADMQAAGLNPILAYTQGGASTPAGSAGSGYQTSGSSAGGHSASAAVADAASGKKADMDYLSVIFNSAGSLLSAVGSLLPGIKLK